MPSSLFLTTLPRKMSDADRALNKARREILGGLGRYASHGPELASTCYVWPSSECPVGCGHCNYASPTNLRGMQRYSVARTPDDVMRVMNTMGLWKAVLSGGGEPMVEPEFCERFINEVNSPHLAEIELITSAFFAPDRADCEHWIKRLVAAWRGRSGTIASPTFSVRISLDWFHARRIGVEPTAQVIEVLGADDSSDINCYIRSVLLDNDPTFTQLAERLNGRLSPIEDYRQRLHLPDGRAILIYYKNLILEGRMTRRRLSKLAVDLPAESEVAAFGERFRNGTGHHVPARVYNGPEVRHLEGLACLIEDDGRIRILEGNDPSRSPYVADIASWSEAVRYLYADPLTVYLVDKGPEALAALISDEFPEAGNASYDTNQLYHLTEHILGAPARRLYAMLRVLDEHLAAARVSVDATVLAKGWETFHKYGRC